MAQWRSATLSLLAVCSILAGCLYSRPPAPPAPTRTVTPKLVDVADHSEVGDCGHVSLTTDSGQVLDVDLGSGGRVGCPVSSGTPFLIGDGRFATVGDDQYRPLVLAGTVDGAPWLGILQQLAEDSWYVRFEAGEGAFLESDGLHLSSGLLLPLAAGFVPPTYVEAPFPLRYNDAVYVNRAGEVVRVEIPGPY